MKTNVIMRNLLVSDGNRKEEQFLCFVLLPSSLPSELDRTGNKAERRRPPRFLPFYSCEDGSFYVSWILMRQTQYRLVSLWQNS